MSFSLRGDRQTNLDWKHSRKYLEINSLKIQPEKGNRPTNVQLQPLRRRQNRDSFILFTSTLIQLGQPNRESRIPNNETNTKFFVELAIAISLHLDNPASEVQKYTPSIYPHLTNCSIYGIRT